MIYAISDIHGDLNRAFFLLHAHGVIDKDGEWMAEDSTLVCCGDSTDRGRHGIATLKFFQNLAKKAKDSGGRVIHLMGNHDALILCLSLEYLVDSVDYEHHYIFKANGGKSHEAVSLSRLHELRRYVQSFPLVCKIDNYLFQHADGFDFYTNRFTQNMSPEEKIKIINQYGNTKAQTSFGAWNLFYDITEERYWNNSVELMDDYLEGFDVKAVVHGHTGFLGNSPMFYLDNRVINIDAAMSNGYRDEPERGCLLVIDSPGKDIVV